MPPKLKRTKPPVKGVTDIRLDKRGYSEFVRIKALEIVTAFDGRVSVECLESIKQETGYDIPAFTIRRWWHGKTALPGSEDEFVERQLGAKFRAALTYNQKKKLASLEIIDQDEFQALSTLDKYQKIIDIYTARMVRPGAIEQADTTVVNCARIVAFMSDKIRSQTALSAKVTRLAVELVGALERHGIDAERFLSYQISALNETDVRAAQTIQIEAPDDADVVEIMPEQLDIDPNIDEMMTEDSEYEIVP